MPNETQQDVWESWEEDVKLFLLELKASQSFRQMGPEREEKVWQEFFVDMASSYDWPEPKFTKEEKEYI